MSEGIRDNRTKSALLKIIILCFAISFLVIFRLSAGTSSDPVKVTLVPEVPREGDTVLVTFKLNNPHPEELNTQYRFYIDGHSLLEGDTTIPARSSKTYQHLFYNPLKMGEQMNFKVVTRSEHGDFSADLSSPPYPPQVWSSFVSFAAFSTSIMGSMSTAMYYNDMFSRAQLDVGIVLFLVLIMLLIFREVTQPSQVGSLQGGGSIPVKAHDGILGTVRRRFGAVTWILLIVFVGAVYTKIVFILLT